MAAIQETPQQGRTTRHSTRVDMTPLVDLGFLLITFFMFCTTFDKPNMMQLTLPDNTTEKTGPTKKSNTLTFILGEADRLFWHQEVDNRLEVASFNEIDYSKAGLRQTILEMRKNALEPDKFTVIVKPSNDARYENVVDVLDELAITQTQRHALADLTSKEQNLYAGMK